MAQANLELDLYADLDDSGVNLQLYFGDSCDTAVEKTILWPEIVAKHIDCYTIPSKDCVPYNNKEDLDEAFVLVRTLRAVADNIENRLMSLNTLDRQAWLEANNGEYGGDITPFLKPMKETLYGTN